MHAAYHTAGQRGHSGVICHTGTAHCNDGACFLKKNQLSIVVSLIPGTTVTTADK